jgi:hypothetical protein
MKDNKSKKVIKIIKLIIRYSNLTSYFNKKKNVEY